MSVSLHFIWTFGIFVYTMNAFAHSFVSSFNIFDFCLLKKRKRKEKNIGLQIGQVRSRLWKDIRKEGALLQNKVVFFVGNGRRVKFWKDNWCGNFTLCNSFPSLYAL